MIQQIQIESSYGANDKPLQSAVIRDNQGKKIYYTATEFRKVTKADLNHLLKKHGRI